MSIASEESKKYWVGVSVYLKIGPIRFKKLIDYFKEVELIWSAQVKDLIEAGLEKHIADDFVEKRKKINPNQEIEKILKENIKLLTIQDDDYPPLLKKISNPPFLIYYKGKIDFHKNHTLAIVGTRRLSPYGRQAAYEISKNLSESGITTISGMALGIDTIAHQTTLELGGKTIAVLGSGMDSKNMYPQSNFSLAQKIIDSEGAVMTEFPVGTPGLAYNFPLRNRIVSGLSSGVLVIESPSKGGSLITANYAKEQGRKIFALPGNIHNKNSSGTNELIKNNDAKLVTSADDILKDLKITSCPGEQVSPGIKNQIDSKEEKILLKYLGSIPIHIDKLVKLSGLNSQIVTSTITMMEIKGTVKNLGNMNYISIF